MKKVRRYYIQFSRKGAYNPRTGRYTRCVWPILFHTRSEAKEAIDALPIFRNHDARGHHRRLVSASIEFTDLWITDQEYEEYSLAAA